MDLRELRQGLARSLRLLSEGCGVGAGSVPAGPCTRTQHVSHAHFYPTFPKPSLLVSHGDTSLHSALQQKKTNHNKTFSILSFLFLNWQRAIEHFTEEPALAPGQPQYNTNIRFQGGKDKPREQPRLAASRGKMGHFRFAS